MPPPSRTRGVRTGVRRANKNPYATRSRTAAMECDTEDEEFIPGVRDILSTLRQATLSPPPPPPSSGASVPTLNPLVMSMASTLESIDFGAIAMNHPALLDGWSQLSLRLLTTIVETLSNYQPGPNTSCHHRALVSVRMRLRQVMNAVDESAEKLGVRLSHTCPNSCLASREGTPAVPPPPSKSYADAVVEARPCSPIPTLPTGSTRPVSAPHAPHKDKAPALAPATLPRPPANAGLPPRPTMAPPKPKVSVPAVSSPIRLVVRFGGNPPEELRSKPQTELFRKVSSMLDVHPTIKGVTILGAHWNKSGNIIISFPDDVPQNVILALRPGIRAALGIAESVAISIDTPWAKMLISSVPARAQPGAPVFSEDDIATSFARNPEIKKLSITRPPRWIRNPSNIAGAHSSFVFAFEDPDGSIARRLMKTSLFAFGAPVTIKRWQENAKTKKPRNHQGPKTKKKAPARDNDAPMQAA